MTHTNAVAQAYAAVDGVIDKLELETSIPKSSRDFLAAWQAKIVGGVSTRKDEDRKMLNIQSTWMLQRHRITA